MEKTQQKKKQQKPSSPEKIKSKLEAKILRFLSYKARSISETYEAGYKYLRRYSLSEEEKESLVSAAVKLMQDAGYLDDHDYVISYINEQKRRTSPRGPYYISQFLRTKGVKGKLIKELLQKHYSPEEELVGIKKLAEKKKGKEPHKLINYLLRRGFSRDLVYSVVDRNSKSN